MKSVLVVAGTDLQIDPRVYRQIAFLSRDYRMVAIGKAPPSLPAVEFIALPAPPARSRQPLGRIVSVFNRVTRRYDALARAQYAGRLAKCATARPPVDLVIAHDIEMLLLGDALARRYGAKLVLDAHELEPWNRAMRWKASLSWQGYWKWVCRTVVPRASAIVTVNEHIAAHYQTTYGVPAAVITNAPFFESQQPSPVDGRRIRLVYHGATNRSRELERMVQLMDLLDERFTLDLILLRNDEEGYRRLRAACGTRSRITFRNPVPMPAIARALNDYDLGVLLIPPSTPNQEFCLPNKLFEFIQGRLAVAVGPSPEMARVVRAHRLGIVSGGFSVPELAAKLNALTPGDISRFKQNAHAAASVLCAEENRERYLTVVRQAFA